MRSQLKTRQVTCCLAAILLLCGTSTFAGPRVTRSASPARAASRSGAVRLQSRGAIPRSAIRRSAATRSVPSRVVQHAPARRPGPAQIRRPTVNRSQSRSHAMIAPRSHHVFSRSNRRPRNVAIHQHRPHHARRLGSRHSGLNIGFGFTIGQVAPPLVSVFEPLCVEPVVVSSPVVVAPQPAVQVPAIQPALPAPQGVLLEAIVSRDDDIAPKKIPTVDGIMLKIEDTDRHPLDVDIELNIHGNEHDFKDLPIGSRVDVYGQSGQLYHVDILAIDDDTETLRFAISQ